jgi:crossover junction endodeoxyribonuclease RuvC
MIKVLLPGVQLAGPDAADALAVAIADAHIGGR